MRSSVEFWDRADAIENKNRTPEGRIISEDVWIGMNLIFGLLNTVDDTLKLLARDPACIQRSTSISLLDTLMEEIDEKLRILEAEIQKQVLPV